MDWGVNDRLISCGLRSHPPAVTETTDLFWCGSLEGVPIVGQVVENAAALQFNEPKKFLLHVLSFFVGTTSLGPPRNGVDNFVIHSGTRGKPLC